MIRRTVFRALLIVTLPISLLVSLATWWRYGFEAFVEFWQAWGQTFWRGFL